MDDLELVPLFLPVKTGEVAILLPSAAAELTCQLRNHKGHPRSRRGCLENTAKGGQRSLAAFAAAVVVTCLVLNFDQISS